ncbi:unnamed protein product [Somion occarium]
MEIARPQGNPAVNAEVENSKPVSLSGLHKDLPSTLEVRQGKDTGRGLYARDRLVVGSILFATRPHVSVLSTPQLESYCSYCCSAAPSQGLKRCTRCRKIWYCNATCQNADWAEHKHECSALQRWQANAPSPDLSIPSDAIRCLGRILWGIQRTGLDSIWTREFSGMQSHRSSLPPSAFESHTHLAHSVVRYLGISSPAELAPFGLASAGDLVDLISRFTTNTFTLTSPSLTPVGICISPTMALVNHSCEPNVVMVFPHTPNALSSQEPLMHLIVIREISPGDQVFVSYVDTSVPRDLRQKELKETYNFVCHCSLCIRQTEVDPRTAMSCPKSCGGICPLPTEENDVTQCVKCKAVVTSAGAVLDAVRVGNEGLQKAISLQVKDPAKAKQLTSNLIPIITSAGLTPSAHPLLAMTRLHLELLLSAIATSISQDVLDEAIRTSAKYNEGLSNVLPYGHPVRAIAVAELGKLLAVDEPSPRHISSLDESTQFTQPAQSQSTPSGPTRLKLALETLIRAREELNIAFGKGTGGGLAGKEVREGIVRLESEIGQWTRGIRNAIEDARAAGKIAK